MPSKHPNIDGVTMIDAEDGFSCDFGPAIAVASTCPSPSTR